MIKNERQYRITKSEADRFEKALATWDADPSTRGLDEPLLQTAQRAALKSQLDDLKKELREYESLRSGRPALLEVGSMEQLPQAMVKARIVAGLSQKDLADLLGLKEQQIQRYESTDYSGASLNRMLEVTQALGVRVRHDMFLPSAEDARPTLFRRLEEIGLDRSFVKNRLVPRHVWEATEAEKRPGVDSVVFHATAAVGRVFGLTPARVLGALPLEADQSQLAATRFKLREGTEVRRLSAYTIYAHYLALLILEATSDIPTRRIPTDPREVREAIITSYGSIRLESVVRYMWDLGVPVLPLNDPGAFHGACWRVRGRNVVSLKQRTRSLARWVFDALHELGHAGENPEEQEFSVIEAGDDVEQLRGRDEERRMNRFAADVLLDGRAEELAKLCAAEAKRRAGRGASLPHLKAAVVNVSEREAVPTDVLANYLAYRLSYEGQDWWGAANNLQSQAGKPWGVVRDVLLERTSFSKLNPADQDLLSQALVDEED